jgi:AhpD family alkylhydroperoxidase
LFRQTCDEQKQADVTPAKRRSNMQARMKNPVMVLPEALKAVLALSKAAEDGVPDRTRKLVHLRASQINGCSVCVDMHARELRMADETDNRLFAVAAWRDTPYFTDGERAALALTEALTRISDRADPVPDEVWDEAAKHYDERALAALVIQIGVINLFNRVNVATRQVAGEWATQRGNAQAMSQGAEAVPASGSGRTR